MYRLKFIITVWNEDEAKIDSSSVTVIYTSCFTIDQELLFNFKT